MHDRRIPAITRLRSLLLAVSGGALILISLSWDWLRGADPSLGRKQLAGVLAGGALIVAAVWLRRGRHEARPAFRIWSANRLQQLRWAAVFLLVAPATVLALWLSREDLFAWTPWLFWSYVAGLCLVLPLRFGWLVFAATALANLALSVIDTIKVGATGLPLTMLDLRIAAANPAGLWEALKLPAWTRYAALAALAVGAIYLLYEAVITAQRALRSGPPRPVATRAIGRLLGLALVVLLAAAYFERLFQQLGGYDEAWDTVGVAQMAAEIGVLPYLAYSRRIESERSGDFFRGSVGADPPPAEEVRAAILNYLDFGATPDGKAGTLPNIVIVLAESTFDPNTAFRLDRRVASPLFDAGDDTVATGPFVVNVIGGGTWVTEFETITGLDSRLFGYAGYYTHSSLAQYVGRSLFTHLAARGYRTSAFFPHEGHFYNYRNAYRAYGAERIYDSADQGFPADWSMPDTRIVEQFERILGPAPDAPIFSYLLLNENHGPHPCHFAVLDPGTVRFADSAELAPNCALHEYLRRLASTETAVASLVRYLRGIEARDGRPFVLLVYGDHQPFTFTGIEWVPFDFAPLRTAQAVNRTFYHLLSSAPRRLRCCGDEIPASLVPTLLSAYAASGPDDLYLGVNLWLFQRCGADAVGNGPLTGLFADAATVAAADLTDSGAPRRRSASCRDAYARALGAYRQSGIIAAARAP